MTDNELWAGAVVRQYMNSGIHYISSADGRYCYSPGRKAWYTSFLNADGEFADTLFVTEYDAIKYLNKNRPVMLSSIGPGTKFRFKSTPTGNVFIKTTKADQYRDTGNWNYLIVRECDGYASNNSDTEVIVVT